MSTNETSDETRRFRMQIEKQMDEAMDRLIGQTMLERSVMTDYSNIANNAVSYTNPTAYDGPSVLDALRESMKAYKPPALAGTVYVIGNAADAYYVAGLLDKTTFFRQTVVKVYNGYPDKCVMLTSTNGSEKVVKVILESPEQTYRKWDEDGIKLADLIKRLEAANR